MYYNFTSGFVQRVLQKHLESLNLDRKKPDDAVKAAEKKLKTMPVSDFKVTINHHYSGIDETWIECSVQLKPSEPYYYMLIIMR